METQTLLERQIDELYKEAIQGHLRGRRVGTLRKVLAQGLKIVAAGSGLVIATGEWPNLHQGLGVATLVAVLVDSVSSNHKRLIAEVEAGHTFAALQKKAKNSYNLSLGILQAEAAQGGVLLSATDPRVIELQRRVHVSLEDGIAEIRAKLAQVDIAALRTLSLEHERAAAQ